MNSYATKLSISFAQTKADALLAYQSHARLFLIYTNAWMWHLFIGWFEVFKYSWHLRPICRPNASIKEENWMEKWRTVRNGVEIEYSTFLECFAMQIVCVCWRKLHCKCVQETQRMTLKPHSASCNLCLVYMCASMIETSASEVPSGHTKTR